MPSPTRREIAKMLDHSFLRPGTTDAEFEAGIDEALELDVASVCIQPHYLKKLVRRLRGSSVFSSTVIGFPHGAHTQASKLHEASEALSLGCQELDVVVNTGKVRSGDFGYVRDELGAIIDAAHDAHQKVKVIFETALLSEEEKIRLCVLSSELGADWVKTSTGFGSAGATVADVTLMRKHSASDVEVKASGGVRTLEELLAFRAAGATRIGTSKSRDLLQSLL